MALLLSFLLFYQNARSTFRLFLKIKSRLLKIDFFHSKTLNKHLEKYNTVARIRVVKYKFLHQILTKTKYLFFDALNFKNSIFQPFLRNFNQITSSLSAKTWSRTWLMWQMEEHHSLGSSIRLQREALKR
jgi:hypothetical protein